ncbi:uncharacterized protein LOC124530912 [Vanessa cardui]|uniref:uncharacterized protein LOC124530912 n=1 Tax=Vanessa cardui TaxID=171605 RepID=UPI001F12DBEB|nr:uncharacterized protein LOC124530912 [Vanessa cardui]
MSNVGSSLSSPQDLENQDEYRPRLTLTHINQSLLSLPDDPMWNSLICALVLMAVVSVAVDFENILLDVFDIIYNVVYALHVLTMAYSQMINSEDVSLSWWSSWSMNDNNRHGSVVGTTLKYCYIFLVLRLSWVLIWLHIDKMESQYTKQIRRTMSEMHYNQLRGAERFEDSLPGRFISAIYVINKMFIPIGPSIAPANDLERVICLLVMMTGCLVVTGAAVASLSLVISIYMRPEETFRTRYRLIMKEMQVSNIPLSLRDKVEKFYKMYWHKQRAVSVTKLLPLFPPSFTATVYTDIYFKATQKCRMLRDLSYQFLSEVSKKMETIHYIPGDTIIKRNHKKSSTIYITYGDVEMLTAEDDCTAMLRMIRGTILSPCAASPVTACGRAHVEIRAATFCTAHVLNTADLWRTVIKYGKMNGQGAIALGAFNEHFEKVKKHYATRIPDEAKYKSSILHFKRNLMDLKESKDAAGNRQLSQTDIMIEIAGCYIMRNRADASLTDEADAICLRPTFPCILQPKSSLQIAWNSFVTVLIIIVCITHPYYLVYKKHAPLEFRFYDYVVTVIYTLDLIVYLSTGANVEDGVPITLAQTSSQQARNKWFVLDIIGTLPIFEFIGDGHFAGLNKLLRLSKVFRMLKRLEDECVYHSNFLRFMSYSVLLLLSCYFLAALQQGFMCFQFGYCLVSNFTHAPFWENQPLDEDTVENRITFGLYWAISMITFTTHMETWGIENLNNVLYTMFVLEICIVLYISIEAIYSATIMVTTALREDYESCIENVASFLIKNEVDPIISQRFIEYLQLRWYTDKAYSITNQQSSIFYDLPAHVYQDIVTRQRSKYILCIPFMKLINKEDLKNISSKAKLFCTSPNEILLNTGDMVNEMYVVKRGICEVISPDTKEVVGEINCRSHFGVFVCLLRLPAYYTIRAVTYVEVFSISRKHLLNVIGIPQINDAIQFIKDQPLYPRVQIRRESFMTYTIPEPAPSFEKFREPRKFEQDNAFLQPFYRLGLLSFLRYIFPRFTIRPDSRYVVHHEWFRGCCAILSAMVYPGYTYLVIQWPWLYFIATMLDFSAYFDILQRMLIGYYNDRGILVYHPASTAAHYLKGAFLTDLFGCLPLERLETSWKESFQDKYREAPAKQFLMLNRVLQLYRMPSALLGLNGLIRRDLLLVIKAIPLFLALLNVLTCFMVYCSANIFYTIESSSWFIVPHDDKGVRFNLTESPWNLHLGSYFWIVYETTTTGYSSFKPSNFNIMRVLITGMTMGALITTYFSVRIISIRANVNKALASFQEHIKDITVFMNRENLDPQLQKQVLDYYEYNWDKMGGFDYRNVLKLCEQITLRTDAILHIYGATFSQCPILNQSDVSLLRTIARAVRSFYFTKDTTIIDVDDVIPDIYIVDKGSVELNDSRDADVSITLIKGSMFGNLHGDTIRCPVSITTKNQVHLLQINSQGFFNIIEDYPAVFELLKYYRPTNENYICGIGSSTPIVTKDPSATISTIIREQRFFRYFNIRQFIIRLYLIIVSLFSIYADVYNAGFQDNSPLLISSLYLFDFCFLWKFFIQYYLPRIVEIDDDDVLNSLLKNREKYYKTEFKFDVISFIPFEILSLLSKNYTMMAFSCLRLNRMFRIVTVYKCLNRHHRRISINLTISTVLTVLIWFTVFVHIAACLWHFIGVVEEETAPKSSWIYNDMGKPWCHSYYICSLYFVLTTFTQNGVGDILPKKQSEVVFVSILQLISTMMFMVYVGELSNIIQYQSFRSFNFYSSYLELQEFLKNNRVSKNLVSLVNKYSLHLWRDSRGLQVPHFLHTAPYCFKLKVMSAAYLYHLNDHQIFKGCEPAFLRQLVGLLQLYTYNEGMFIVKNSEITDSMYFIHTGRVTEITPGSNKTKLFYEGESFGELQGLIYDTPYMRSYKTSIRSQILTLCLRDWKDLLKHFPRSKKNISKFLKTDDSADDGFNGDDGPNGSKGGVNSMIKDDDSSTNAPTLPLVSFLSNLAQDITTNKSTILDNFDTPPGPSNFLKSLTAEKSAEKISSKSSEELEDSLSEVSQAALKIEDSDLLIDYMNMDVTEPNIDDDETKIRHKQYVEKQKSSRAMQSVEDYIIEKHGYSDAANSQDVQPKKRKVRVRYRETNLSPRQQENYELKPIINMTVDERNLKSLDSDMQPTQKVEETDSVKDSLSHDSIESLKPRTHSPK